MLTSIRSSMPLLLSTAFLLMGVGLLHTHIALLGRGLGFSVAMIGVLTSAYYAGFLVGTYTIPQLTHRIGHIRTFAFCAALLTLVVLIQALDPAYGVWLVLRVLQGMMLVGLYAIIESWLNAASDPRHRSSVFAIYMMVNLGASAAAQQFLRIRGEGFVLFCIVAILFCIASLPVVASHQSQPQLRSMPKVQIRRLFRLAPTALVSALLSGLALGAFWGLLPLYAVARGLGVGGIGTYMSVAIAGGVVLQWPLGRFSDRIDRRLALSLISATAALAALVNLLLPNVGAAAMVVIFVFGGMSFTLYPIAVAHLVDYVDRDELLAASSTVLLVNGVGSAVGPLVAGALMNLLQPQLLFVWFAVLDLMIASYAFYRFIHRKREVTSDDNFVPLVNTTPSSLDLHSSE
jgi:MFS family permease